MLLPIHVWDLFFFVLLEPMVHSYGVIVSLLHIPIMWATNKGGPEMMSGEVLKKNNITSRGLLLLKEVKDEKIAKHPFFCNR